MQERMLPVQKMQKDLFYFSDLADGNLNNNDKPKIL